jgi:hypothetical protein
MDLIKTQLIESIFAVGGEMGARMRALDWSATVLGPLEHRNRCGPAFASCWVLGARRRATPSYLSRPRVRT